MIIIKNKRQIAGIRKSCNLSSMTIKYIESFLQPGISTEEIDDEIHSFIKKNNGIPAPLGYHGFPKSSCTSINEVICHGIPRKTDILKDGDIIKIDVSTIFDGFFGDTCKTFPIGKISEEAKDLIKHTQRCLEIGIEQAKNNNRFGEIGRNISKYAKENNLGVVHQFAGHGVGLSLHEEPQIPHDNKVYNTQKMKIGMIFTIEPMICSKSPNAIILEDGWTAVTSDSCLSAQFEHTILITDSDPEILTL